MAPDLGRPTSAPTGLSTTAATSASVAMGSARLSGRFRRAPLGYVAAGQEWFRYRRICSFTALARWDRLRSGHHLRTGGAVTDSPCPAAVSIPGSFHRERRRRRLGHCRIGYRTSRTPRRCGPLCGCCRRAYDVPIACDFSALQRPGHRENVAARPASAIGLPARVGKCASRRRKSFRGHRPGPRSGRVFRPEQCFVERGRKCGSRPFVIPDRTDRGSDCGIRHGGGTG